MKPYWVHAAEFAGLSPTPRQIEKMGVYSDWLVAEGAPAGGIGPAEIDRVDLRHLADSVLFLSQIPEKTTDVWDLGSGVGLPGIPLAICRPDLELSLIDRAGRRVDLMRRAIRILDLDNCRILKSDIHALEGRTQVIVSRASLPPARLAELVKPLLAPGGMAIVSGSWVQPPDHPGWEVIEIPPDVLDRAIWLLIMRRE